MCAGEVRAGLGLQGLSGHCTLHTGRVKVDGAYICAKTQMCTYTLCFQFPSVTQRARDRQEENKQKGETVGGGERERETERDKEREREKKSLSSFRPSRPPVAFQPVSFAGLGKWSTAASLTYIVCIMPLLELPSHGESW